MSEALRDYLKTLFETESELVPLPGVDQLPMLYSALFELYRGNVDDRICAFAVDRQQMHLTPRQISGFMQFLRDKYQIPFVYVGALREPHAVERMLAARIPFIAPGHSLYLPFAGVVLGKQSKTPAIQKEHLGCCAQMIVLGVLLKKLVQPVKITDVLELLPFGKSTAFTAFRELEYFGLGQCRTQPGHRTILFQFVFSGKELWNAAQNVLFNPCKRTVGVVTLPTDIPIVMAGADALAQISMLNELPPTVFATELALFRKRPFETFPAETAETKLQLWQYNPCVWGKDKIDLLSLALSLKNNPDERVQIALETAIKEFPW